MESIAWYFLFNLLLAFFISIPIASIFRVETFRGKLVALIMGMIIINLTGSLVGIIDLGEIAIPVLF